jgi:hypothetical protein
MELANFLEKNQMLQLQTQSVALKIHHVESFVIFLIKKIKNLRFNGQNKLFKGTLSFSPWAI